MNACRGTATALLALLVVAGPRAVAAQEASAVARAKELFEGGKRLLENKQYERACPLLAESFQLAAATGPLLALAVCHERQGKTATAWSEYSEVVARTRSQGQSDWADRAERAAAALEPKLCKLRVVLEAGTESVVGLVVKRDGQVLGGSAIGVSFPVDPGVHLVEASAPGRRAWATQVVATDGAALSIAVPPPPAAEVAVSGPDAPVQHEGTSTRLPVLRTIGIATGAVGLVGIGLGTYFSLRAISQNRDSKTGVGACNTSDVCGAEGKTERLDAVQSANFATAAFIAGGVLLAGGVTLFVVGRPAASHVGVTASPIVGPSTVGASLHASF